MSCSPLLLTVCLTLIKSNVQPLLFPIHGENFQDIAPEIICMKRQRFVETTVFKIIMRHLIQEFIVKLMIAFTYCIPVECHFTYPSQIWHHLVPPYSISSIWLYNVIIIASDIRILLHQFPSIWFDMMACFAQLFIHESFISQIIIQ